MQKTEKSNTKADPVIEKMFEAGVHYGYSKTRRHPSVSSFIYTTKNRTDIIDLEKTNDMLKEAVAFFEKLGSENKKVLLVGTKAEAREAIENMAKRLEMPYVTERWIGGTISNFSEIKKRIAELEKYQKDSESGDLEKYTKKERLVMGKKMERLSRYYSGLIGLKKNPDVVFVVDTKEENIATTEARGAGIPVAAVVNSDTNLKDIDFPIVGNDASMPSIKFFTQALTEAYERGKNV